MTRWLRVQWFAIQSGMKPWLDHPISNFMNALVLGIALALPWSLLQGVSAMLPSMDRWVGDPEISIFFKVGTPISMVEDARARVMRERSVSGAEIIDPARALVLLKEQSQFPDLADALPSNPLPYTLVVRFRLGKDVDETLMNGWVTAWKKLDGVEHVQFDSQWIRRLRTLLLSLQVLALGVSALVGVLVIIVTFNTVRLQLVGQKQEVHVLKALGASDAEVGRPTLWWSLSLAMLAYAMAWGGVVIAMLAADSAVGSYIREFDRQFNFSGPSAIWSLIGLSAWTLLVMLGAWASVKRTVWNIR
jgi:cell division transport system permease protein